MRLPAEDCPHWERCSASLCPLDTAGRHLLGEPVCRLAREAVKEGGVTHVTGYAGEDVANRVVAGLSRLESVPDVARRLSRAATSRIKTGNPSHLHGSEGTPTGSR